MGQFCRLSVTSGSYIVRVVEEGVGQTSIFEFNLCERRWKLGEFQQSCLDFFFLVINTGWFRTTVFYHFFLANIICLRNRQTQSYFDSICMDILIFWYINMVRWKKSCISESCLYIIIAPFQLISIRIELWDTPLNVFEHLRHVKISPRYPQTPLHTPLHIPDSNRHHQTPADTVRHPRIVSWSV